MALEVTTICPLGCECEKVANDGIQRCAWYVKLQGKNPQDGSDVDEWRCSMAWQPLLMIEANGINSHTNASVQSLRNETVARQDKALEAVKNVQTIEHK